MTADSETAPEWKPGDCAPFLMLAHALGVPYRDVLQYADACYCWGKDAASMLHIEHPSATLPLSHQRGRIAAVHAKEIERRISLGWRWPELPDGDE